MKIPFVFTDNMVLQRNKNINFWGEGQGEIIVVLNNIELQTKATNGKWFLGFPAQKAGGPYEIRFKDDLNTIVLKNVMIGDVWLACGQSNMEMPTFATKNGFDYVKSLKGNNIRFFTVARRTTPNENINNWHFESVYSCDTQWEICNQETALHFSAIGFYFADLLERARNVPVGIISCNYQGTCIEAWIQQDLLFNHPEIYSEYIAFCKTFDEEKYNLEHNKFLSKMNDFCQKYNAVELAKEFGIVKLRENSEIKARPTAPMGPYNPNWWGVLYKNMISTIVPYSASGVLWYQGESNVKNHQKYFDLFRMLVCSWRKEFMQELPFFTVKIAPYNHYTVEDGRELFVLQQIKASEDIKNVFIVDTDDVDECDEIHPIDKFLIAKRIYEIVEKVM